MSVKKKGRKTGYRNELCGMMLDYYRRFVDLREDEGDCAAVPLRGYPTLSKFAIKIGVTYRTLLNWAEAHEEFRDAMDWCKMITRDIVTERGLDGTYDNRVVCKILELNTPNEGRTGRGGGNDGDASGCAGVRLTVVDLTQDAEDAPGAENVPPDAENVPPDAEKWTGACDDGDAGM